MIAYEIYIDLSGAYHTKIYNNNCNMWQYLPTSFSTIEIKNIFDIDVPFISKEELLNYKRIISRSVDLADVSQMD